MNFVTVFDKNFLSRGIALYESLIDQCRESFVLYVVAIDGEVEKCFHTYSDRLDRAKVISTKELIEFYPILKTLKQERTHREFCWTLSSFSIQYVLLHYHLESVTYLDSDTFFYADPKILLDEAESAAVLLTEHNFWPERGKATEDSGKFCVQFMQFKNNEAGRRILEEWKAECERECIGSPEGGKYGDQKYLDEWESRYRKDVFVSPHLGAGVAVWNMQRFSLHSCKEVYVVDKVSKVKWPIIFYHFSQLRQIGISKWYLGNHGIQEDFKEKIYRPYIERIARIEKEYDLRHIANVNYIQEVSLTRFFPIPYTGKHTITISFSDECDADKEMRCALVSFNDRKGIASIFYKKSLYRGQWCIIKRVENIEAFSEQLHEVLWALMYHECFAGFEMQDVWFEILRRIKLGELMMLECESEKLESVDIVYPCFSEVTVLRNKQDIISKAGATLYSELVIADDRIMAL